MGVDNHSLFSTTEFHLSAHVHLSVGKFKNHGYPHMNVYSRVKSYNAYHHFTQGQLEA